jgi:hypothetical protein
MEMINIGLVSPFPPDFLEDFQNTRNALNSIAKNPLEFLGWNWIQNLRYFVKKTDFTGTSPVRSAAI